MRRAASIGSSVAEVCRRLFEQKGVDGLRPARAVVALVKTYGPDRLRWACARVLAYETVKYRSVKDCLKHELDLQPPEPVREPIQQEFAFARPEGYFANGGQS
jgi:hypothetical protein